MDLLIAPNGAIRCIYAEQIDLSSLGKLAIQRASHVEPTVSGGWTADLAPVGGPVLGPFRKHSAALAAEHDWLVKHWLKSST